METAKLKKFAQLARDCLSEQVSAKISTALAAGSVARSENNGAVQALAEAVRNQSKEQVIERVAYTWFNRFCSFRFMDVNRFTRVGIVSPSRGQYLPEILTEAMMGHIDCDLMSEKLRRHIFSLLDGQVPCCDPRGEAYRLLVASSCQRWHRVMPFVFKPIDDYTELLMPEDLLSENSIPAHTCRVLVPEVCMDVEVIGWLYQFYISDKKDQAFESLKKNQKIAPENLPAATQLFTPHWIVRYMVENSLGRMWMLNHPGSRLSEQMDYYIRPEKPEKDFFRIEKPEEIRLCDPACGSGHMLIYAFDLLYAIYEEEGYDPSVIPELILTRNIFGIDIEERAGELASFALTMKACMRQPQFFKKRVQPNICVMKSVRFSEGEISDYLGSVDKTGISSRLKKALRQFEDADIFGSLICPEITETEKILQIAGPGNISEDILLSITHKKVLKVLLQADYLSPEYHVVIANPPYLGAKSMNNRLAKWAAENYPRSKYDLFAMFIERCLKLVPEKGYVALITMQSWMFLSSFEALRKSLMEKSILSMAHLGTRGFDHIGGEVVATTAFITENVNRTGFGGIYLRLTDGKSEAEKDKQLRETALNPECHRRFRCSSEKFEMIPTMPLTYWMSGKLRRTFNLGKTLKSVGDTRQGMATSDNRRFVRLWHEVSLDRICHNAGSRKESVKSGKKWFPYNKGGSFRRWYGNCDHIVNWEHDGKDLLDYAASLYGSPTRTIKSMSEYFKPSISWSKVTAGYLSMRYYPEGYIFDVAGCSIFTNTKSELKSLLGFANSGVANAILACISPTLNFEAGQVAQLPVTERIFDKSYQKIPQKLIEIYRSDWDSFETSRNFTGSPLLSSKLRQETLEEACNKIFSCWNNSICEAKKLEEENNQKFIAAYELEDELTPDVRISEITLLRNPPYRYGFNRSSHEPGSLLAADTMRELISYAVGCMFGRFSLDKSGLILASQGDGIENYLKKVPSPCFPADRDNVIPVLRNDFFKNDITERFRKFLCVTFGEKNCKRNIMFIEKSLNVKEKRNYTLRSYFLDEFYRDHIKRYKKRPIYWLFSSPEGSFSALIYMHRYRPDTASVVLNSYLRKFRNSLISRKNWSESSCTGSAEFVREKTKALKEINKLNKMISELEDYERDVLYPLATKQISIDLDDGVRVNYPKLGAALKKVPGL